MKVFLIILFLLFSCNNSTEPERKLLNQKTSGTADNLDFGGVFLDNNGIIEGEILNAVMSLVPELGSEIPDTLICYFGVDDDGNYLSSQMLLLGENHSAIGFQVEKYGKLNYRFGDMTTRNYFGTYNYTVNVNYY